MRSTNPFDAPLIDPAYYSNPIDLKVMSEAFRELFKVAKSSDKFKTVLQFGTNCAKCVETVNDSCDAFYECLAKERADTTLHLAGSCRMGAANDTKAVVDEWLRVRGVERLRVIDASVMPQNVEPGTYAATVMIGEKGSDMIADDNKSL